jgi:hypothetical protein
LYEGICIQVYKRKNKERGKAKKQNNGVRDAKVLVEYGGGG